MNTIQTVNPAQQADDPVRSVILEIELAFARHGSIPHHTRLSTLTALLATSIAEAALASTEQPPEQTAAILSSFASATVTREVDNILRAQGTLQ